MIMIYMNNIFTALILAVHLRYPVSDLKNHIYNSHDSSVGIALGWMMGVLGFDSWQGLGIFPFTTASRTALVPTQPPIQWVQGALSLGVKRPGREADHSPP
jgi:hypothetical protein